MYEEQHTHDDIATQLVESIGLENAIMAISRYCDRQAMRSENDSFECLSYVYRCVSHELWRTACTLNSSSIVDRWRRLQSTETK